ncbi:glycosyltransferase family A protein [Sphingomonas sp.]|uniref:glycosyltransferase family 2 protein n=1 Tax=Sphingomonas sp. TaxID=28214 RepID=UPI0025D40E95|nr:glycosyltransferase family A protein [Sphingomonas sp.]MBV9526810.1 glycosyltransferase family 2 protein [Sphingomonas sp.]
MTPEVSAIIIVRDGETFIRDAVDSILLQDGPSFELIVVDDGSTDRTSEIVRGFGGRARMVTHPGRVNLGMSASRNLGIETARGAYVAFLDADDLWLPGKIAEQAAILDCEPSTAMVYGRTMIWRSWDGSGDDFMYGLGVTPDRTYPPGRLFRQLLVNRYQTPTTCNAMMRRDALLAVGGADPSLRGMFEDQLLFAKLLARYPVHVSSRCWARYRQHAASASASNVDGLAIDRAHLRYLSALSAYLGHAGAPLRDRAALGRTKLKLQSRIAARRAKRMIRR